MNVYPRWWDRTVTIYNRYEDPSTRIVKWYRHTMSGCFWRNVTMQMTLDNSTVGSNSQICRIPKTDKYADVIDWQNADDTFRTKYFTLQSGDFIVDGNVTDTVDEYTAGQRSSEVIGRYSKYNKCGIINKFSINTGNVDMEHYLVYGG